MKQSELKITSLESAFSSHARKHGIGVAVSRTNGKNYVVVGATWYPEGNTPAFLKGTAPLTIDTAKELVKALQDKIDNFDDLAKEVEAAQVVAAASEPTETVKRGRGRPKGSTNKPVANKTEEKAPVAKPEINEDDAAILAELGIK